MTITVRMTSPTPQSSQVICSSGNTYVPDIYGQILANSIDVDQLLKAGWVIATVADPVQINTSSSSTKVALGGNGGLIRLGSTKVATFLLNPPGPGIRLTLFKDAGTTQVLKVKLNSTTVQFSGSKTTLSFANKVSAAVIEGLSATAVGIVSNVGSVASS